MPAAHTAGMAMFNPFRIPGLGRRSPAPYSGGVPALARTGSRYLSDRLGAAGDAFMGPWRPILREPQADTQEAWIAATAQTIDALHTSGWMAGGVQSARGQILSDRGLRLNLKPWGNIISNDPVQQAAWARDVEGRFELYVNDPWSCDWGARYTIAQLAGQAVGQFFATGEIVGTLPYEERGGASCGVKVNMMPSSRLSQANGPGENVVQGVELSPRTGAPTAYHFNAVNYATGASIEAQRVAARDDYGKPYVIHLFDNAPSAVRGITPFAPALRIVRQYDQLANATLVGSLMQTIFAATIESQSPTIDLMRALQGLDEQEEYEADEDAPYRNPTSGLEIEGVLPGSFPSLLEARLAWYKSTNIDLGRFGKVAHLFPGEKLAFNRPNNPSGDYLNFSKNLLHEVARAMGITAFQLTGIFDGYTYTTAKMAVDENWPLVLWRRAIVARLYQTVFEAWLEEDIIRGRTVLPGGLAQFYAQRQQICRADWRGPPKPTADDLKTAKARQVERAEGWSSTEGIAADYGNDWVEVADSQKFSDEYRKANGLPILPSIGGGGNGAGSAAVAGGEAEQSRDARIVSAIMAGDNDALDDVLQEDPLTRSNFMRMAVDALDRHTA